MDLAGQLQALKAQRKQTAEMLAHCVTIADSIGQLAEVGKQISIRPAIAQRFIGTVQVGEYIATGKIPESSLVAAVVRVSEDLTPAEVGHA